MRKLINHTEKFLVKFLLILIKIYKGSLSPYIGQNCRYHPTCSSYAYEALQEHGLKKGLLLSIKRIASCHPLGGRGVDLVPKKNELKK